VGQTDHFVMAVTSFETRVRHTNTIRPLKLVHVTGEHLRERWEEFDEGRDQ